MYKGRKKERSQCYGILRFFLVFYAFSLFDKDGILDIRSIVIRITELPIGYQSVFANLVIVQYLII